MEKSKQAVKSGESIRRAGKEKEFGEASCSTVGWRKASGSPVRHEKTSTPTQTRKERTPQQALASLMRYASRAERSSGDVLRLMQGWGIADDDREKILARLREGKFIDDRRFAEAYVRDKVRFSGWGIRKIRSGLSSKGISSDLADAALAAMTEETGSGRVIEILRRKEPSVKGGTNYERCSKLIRYGLSKGFEYEEVIEAARRIIDF